MHGKLPLPSCWLRIFKYLKLLLRKTAWKQHSLQYENGVFSFPCRSGKQDHSWNRTDRKPLIGWRWRGLARSVQIWRHRKAAVLPPASLYPRRPSSEHVLPIAPTKTKWTESDWSKSEIPTDIILSINTTDHQGLSKKLSVSWTDSETLWTDSNGDGRPCISCNV